MARQHVGDALPLAQGRVERLMAAPGTPNACVTFSFSRTSTAAIAALILAMRISAVPTRVGQMVPSRPGDGRQVWRMTHIPWWNTGSKATRTLIATWIGSKRYACSPGGGPGLFSRAALELGIGQPAATKQVARMEQELGARLLHRSTHGVSPTDVGIRYYEKCKLIVHHDEEARSVAALTQSQVQERCASAPRSPSAAACWRRWCWTSCATMRC